jgi:hypothetical protein
VQCRRLEKGYWEVFDDDDFLKNNELLENKRIHQYVSLEVPRNYGKQHVCTAKSQLEKAAENSDLTVFSTASSFINYQSRERRF